MAVKCDQISTRFCVLKRIRIITKILRPQLKTFKFQMADGRTDGRHVVKRLFGHNSGYLAADCPIFPNFA